MKRPLIKIAAGVVLLGALAAGGTALATAAGGDGGDDAQVSGAGADRARAAALEHIGGGSAGSVERESDEGASWEVEVTRGDGTSAEVTLDASYKVIAVESESGSEGDTEDNDEIEDENGQDDAAEGAEDESPEVPGDDGPEGHADEPGSPNANRIFEGEE